MAGKVPAREIGEQREAARRLRGDFAGKRYHIVTYGCQMNAHESETLAGIFEEMGMAEAPDRFCADLVLFNTCCIRDNAERRLFGNIGKLCRHKAEERRDMLIGVCGCMTQQDGVADRLLKRYRGVDFVLGSQGAHRLPSVIEGALRGRASAVASDERVAEGQPIRRANPYLAYVSIMYGCDNYCSYCIVPYVRGPERSRDAADIIREAEALARDGVKEITLLGQNVNSFSGGMDFAGLLRQLDGVVPRIRFMTSHPKDLTDGVIAAVADCPTVARHLHLPVQSGSDAVLRAMNRRYGRARYLELLSKVRQAVPGIGVSSDMIVGFPGETEADFEDTLALAREARLDSAFMFAYSPRAGTRAAAMDGQIDEETKRERLSRLIALQGGIQAGVFASLVGTRHVLLAEGASKRGGGVTGRIGRGITVNVKGPCAAGEMRPVVITEPKHTTLKAVWGDELED